MLSLAYLGPQATFTHQAARLIANTRPPGYYRPVSFPTIYQVLMALATDQVDQAVVPAENSIEGSVSVTVDMLAHLQGLYILGEMVLDISHHLLSFTSVFREINCILGHPQALAQCRHYLEKNLPQATLRETNSSADAAQQVCRKKDGLAAIGTWEGHQTYGIPVLASDIGDYPHNQTRFYLVGKEPVREGSTEKTSLVVSLEKDRPGGLYEILGLFARHQINLSKIESRPAKKELGSYLFFLECEAGHDHRGLQQVLYNLQERKSLLKNLGSYGTIPTPLSPTATLPAIAASQG